MQRAWLNVGMNSESQSESPNGHPHMTDQVGPDKRPRLSRRELMIGVMGIPPHVVGESIRQVSHNRSNSLWTWALGDARPQGVGHPTLIVGPRKEGPQLQIPFKPSEPRLQWRRNSPAQILPAAVPRARRVIQVRRCIASHKPHHCVPGRNRLVAPLHFL